MECVAITLTHGGYYFYHPHFTAEVTEALSHPVREWWSQD